MTEPANKKWWARKARRAMWRINLAWWLDAYLPALLVLSVLFAVAVLILRRSGHPVVPLPFLVYVAALAAAGLGCLAVAHRRFYRPADALVRLEAIARLHNRLTAANEGVGRWPDAIPDARDGLAWQWRRCLLHPGLSLALLTAAAAVPMRPDAAEAARRLEEPLAWAALEEWAAALEQEKIVEPLPVESLKEQVRQLREQPMEAWYSHSSLEATDTLKAQTEQGIRELARHLESAYAGLLALEVFAETAPAAAAREAWEQSMGEAIDGLERGAFPIDKELLSRIKEIDPASFRPLSREELQALQDALASGCRTAGRCTGSDTNLAAAVALSQCWGRGGINRGPGEAPLFFKEQESRLGTAEAEALRNPDLEYAALGDTLAVGEGEHDIDETLYRGPQTGGEVASQGRGGETVWRTSLAPEEQEVLQRYFR